jgi:hypothetical protein
MKNTKKTNRKRALTRKTRKRAEGTTQPREGLIRLDRERIARLFRLEKERRGVSNNELVFVGMANIAKYYWCAMQAIFKSRRNELEFFNNYLQDRLEYSYRLGLIEAAPQNDKAFLEIGNEIRFSDIEKLLKERASHGGYLRLDAEEFSTESGERVMLINPDAEPSAQAYYRTEAAAKGVRVADLEEFPLHRGRLLETAKAERYPSIRWNFEWGKYVAVGIPDGITDRWVYEFKTTRDKGLMRFIKPVALTQADLYGYFFQRAIKRVQIHVTPIGKTETWQSDVDPAAAQEILKKFAEVDAGEMPRPPKPWKCNKCEYSAECPIAARG